MAIDSYMYFLDYHDKYLQSESQVKFTAGKESISKAFDSAFKTGADGKEYRSGLFEVEDYSFDIEQALNIGSQSSGSGAGKVMFNPFSITRKMAT